MKKITLIFISLIFLICQIAYGQYRIYPEDNLVCPNQEVTYNLQRSSNGEWVDIDPTYISGTWSISNGTVISGNLQSLSSITIKWTDGSVSGTIKANNSFGGTFFSKTINLKTIKNLTPGAINGSASVEFGIQTKKYSIDYMNYPDGSSISTYSWIIPPGWSLDGIVSTGSNIYSGKGTSITVTTDNTSGGSIQVAAEKWNLFR